MRKFYTIKISDQARWNGYNDKGVLKPWTWCIENYGEPGILDTYKWNWDTFYTFVFRDEADAVLFALRWS